MKFKKGDIAIVKSKYFHPYNDLEVAVIEKYDWGDNDYIIQFEENSPVVIDGSYLKKFPTKQYKQK